MTGRATPEWIGKSADTKVPDHVKLRIWHRENGRCYLTGRKIRPGPDAYDYEHKIALALWTGDGHGNRESNIFLALREPHKAKTKRDVAQKAKSDRLQKKHLGITQSKSRLQSAGFPRTPKQQRASRPVTPKFDGDILATHHVRRER